MFMSIPLQETFLNAISNLSSLVYDFLPNIIGSLSIFLIGLIIAKWVKKIIVHFLRSINFTDFAKKAKINDFLEKAEFKSKIEDIIGNIFKWFIIFLFTITAINVLGLPTISDVLNNILAYIPNIISAIFVLAIGVLLAGIVERLIKGAVSQIDPKTGRLLGKISSYMMMIFASMAAFNELGIAADLINILFIGLISMLSLGLGLALGLGAKDVVSVILMDWYTKFKNDVEGKEK